MDRRFVCNACGTRWFIPAGRADEPDLTECGSCGEALSRFEPGLRGDEPYGTLPDERATRLDEGA